MKILQFIKADARMFFRNGIIQAYGFLTVLFGISMLFVPPIHRESVLAVMVMVETSGIGFFFAGGIILLEKNQNIFSSLFTTPFGISSFVFARAFILSLIGLSSALVIGVFAGLPGLTLIRILLATEITAFTFSLAGVAVGFRASSLNAYFALSGLLLPLILPSLVLRLVGINSYLLLFLPAEAILLLTKPSFYVAWTIKLYITAFLVLGIWAAVFALIAKIQVRSYLARK